MSAQPANDVCGLRAAVAPPEAFGRSRSEVRLLVTTPTGNQETHFEGIAAVLSPGDLVVLNTSDTRPSAIDLTGVALTLHFSSQTPEGDWIVEFRTADGRRPHRGPVPATFELPHGVSVQIVEPYNDDVPSRLYRATTQGDVAAMLQRHGRMVLYDYVREHVEEPWYHNVYADEVGSAEMASAGRPLTHAVLGQLEQRGVGISSLVLHCGVSSQEAGEAPHAEYYRVPAATLDEVRRARDAGGRIIAVGTTVVRALETVFRTGELEGWTSLLLGDHERPRLVDGVLSGFHPPQASHLALLGTFAGASAIRRSYDFACDSGYLSHEFGDSHLVLRSG